MTLISPLHFLVFLSNYIAPQPTVDPSYIKTYVERLVTSHVACSLMFTSLGHLIRRTMHINICMCIYIYIYIYVYIGLHSTCYAWIYSRIQACFTWAVINATRRPAEYDFFKISHVGEQLLWLLE